MEAWNDWCYTYMHLRVQEIVLQKQMIMQRANFTKIIEYYMLSDIFCTICIILSSSLDLEV